MFRFQLPDETAQQWVTFVSVQESVVVELRKNMTDRGRTEGIHYRLVTDEQLQEEQDKATLAKLAVKLKKQEEIESSAEPAKPVRKRAPRRKPTPATPDPASSDSEAMSVPAEPSGSEAVNVIEVSE